MIAHTNQLDGLTVPIKMKIIDSNDVLAFNLAKIKKQFSQ